MHFVGISALLIWYGFLPLKYIFSRLLQLKQYFPNEVTDEGIVIEVKPLQLLKQYSPNEVTDDGKLKPMANNQIIAGKYDLIYTNKLKSTSINSERLRSNVELVKILQSTNPDLVQYIVPEILKDSESPSADKIRKIVYENAQQKNNNPQNEIDKELEASNKQLDIAYRNSQINLNNAKAKSMLNKNDIDLQKAYSNAVIAKENIRNKQQQAMLKAGKGV